MGYLKELEARKAEVQGHATPQRVGESYAEYLERLKEQAQASNADEWHEKLQRVKGKFGADGIEFVSTKELLSVVGVSQRGHQVGAQRRLAPIMKSLGWEPVRRRGLTPTGLLDQVRGWAREPAPKSKITSSSRCPHCGGVLS